MTGILRLFKAAFNCVIHKREYDLHDADDEVVDGVVKFTEHLLAIAETDSIHAMRLATWHEALHIVFHENPALLLICRPDVSGDDMEHWIDSMASALTEVCEESAWQTASGEDLIPGYGGGNR